MNNIRTGTVSSVDAENRTARVIFRDRGDMVSGVLTVLQNSPLITADISTAGKWAVKGKYASAPRSLPGDNSYVKSAPDVIGGELVSSGAKMEMRVYGWLPYIGQTVLCILADNAEGGGYIIGGV